MEARAARRVARVTARLEIADGDLLGSTFTFGGFGLLRTPGSFRHDFFTCARPAELEAIANVRSLPPTLNFQCFTIRRRHIADGVLGQLGLLGLRRMTEGRFFGARFSRLSPHNSSRHAWPGGTGAPSIADCVPAVGAAQREANSIGLQLSGIRIESTALARWS